MKNTIGVLILSFITQITLAQNTTFNVSEHFKEAQSSDLMILGTFHFNNPGLDSYKPKHDINILSKEKQKELQELLAVIKAYAPTKIAIERRRTSQKRLDSLYAEYLEGRFELRTNEIYQIGFRLAKMLGHKRIYAVDAPAKRNTTLTNDEYSKKENYYIGKADRALLGREMLLDEKFTKMYEFEDDLKTKVSLVDYFLFMNDPEILKASHGHYLIGNFKMGEGNDYFGPDHSMWWYNRNLRIFHNLLQINTPGKDKIFLLIGAGHVPILDFLAETSIDFRKKNFSDYIKEK